MEGQIIKKARSSDDVVDGGSAGIDDENIVSDILTRLPVKSLMRFKCVAKHWCSLIRDPHFMELYRKRSEARQCVFTVIQRPANTKGNLWYFDYDDGKKRQKSVSFLIATVFSDGSSRTTSTIHNIARNKSRFYFTQFLGAINGLVCFINDSTHAVCVFNIATRQVTPWIKSTILMEETQMSGWNRERDTSAYSFGYDPSSKEHKVICKWVIYDDHDDASYEIWEILTVGHNAWRRMDQVPNCHFIKESPYVYVNGSIYWYPLESYREDDNDVSFILVLDVGSEKFRRLQIPDDSGQLNRPPYFGSNDYGYVSLLDMQGRVAILCKTYTCTARLWMCEDNDKNWTRKTIIFPFVWKDGPTVFIHGDVEADKMFLERHLGSIPGTPFSLSLHSYCLKDKSVEKIDLQGLSADCIMEYTRLCTSFCESLYFNESNKKNLIDQHSTRSRLVGFPYKLRSFSSRNGGNN